MNSPMFYPGPLCRTLLRSAGGPPIKRLHGLMALGWAAVFYPFGHPTPYAYAVLHVLAGRHFNPDKVTLTVMSSFTSIGARHEVSKRVEDGRRPPAL
jgi:hypothetical protein